MQTTANCAPRSVLALGALLVAACSSSDDGGGTTTPPTGGSGQLTLIGVDGGFGPILPHRVAELDSTGAPTGGEVAVRTVDDLLRYVAEGRSVLPPTSLPTTAITPAGTSGNQFLVARFSRDIDPARAFVQAGQGPLGVYSVDPATGQLEPVATRLLIGGMTLEGGQFVQWVELDPTTGRLVALVPEAQGFPGVFDDFGGAASLVDGGAVVFVADADGDLGTLETFPAGRTLRLHVPATLEAEGAVDPVSPEDLLGLDVVATTTVGEDLISPEVLIAAPGVPAITPATGDVNVDPATAVTIDFTEAIDPADFGPLVLPGIGSAARIVQGLPTLENPFPYSPRPASVYDLTSWSLTPSVPFTGIAVDGSQPNSALADVRVTLPGMGVSDLQSPSGNASMLGAEVTFRVGPAPGLANAPVVPEAIVAARGGVRPGLSVIDLNGFGQSTGSPVVSGTVPGKGETRWPFNPNVLAGLGSPGISSVDGGSAGVFSLTRDANLDDLLASAPVLEDASDVHIGAALDLVLNNAPPPFGCQGSGGTICALAGLKALDQGGLSGLTPGYPNLVSAAPYPNPPKLQFPPVCEVPNIASEPLTPADTTMANLLIQGDPFGDPANEIPPTGLLGPGTIFAGPSQGVAQVSACATYGARGQIGHFLYVVDRMRGEVVCLNSNRTTPLARIAVEDPVSLAMGPNLDVLAVSSQLSGTVTIIDIDPVSATFHEVIATVPVGPSPRGLAFEPLGEDLLVCCEGNDTVVVIEPAAWTVRNVAAAQVDGPFEIVVTPRMSDFAFQRGVYFAYLAGRDGRIAVYESGPNGSMGWGFDDVIGVVPFTFQSPRALAVDPVNLDASIYVAHEGPIDPATGVAGAAGVGAVSRLRIESALTGQIPLAAQASPNFRDIQFSVPLSISEAAGQLSGIPGDLAFDDLSNMGQLPQPVSAFGPADGATFNGKANVRATSGGFTVNASESLYLLVAAPAEGFVDVLGLGLAGVTRVDTCAHDAGVQSIPVPGVRSLTHYWRQ